VSSGVAPAPVIPGILDVFVVAITHKNKGFLVFNSSRVDCGPKHFIFSFTVP
jgi:hypothetical protein